MAVFCGATVGAATAPSPLLLPSLLVVVFWELDGGLVADWVAGYVGCMEAGWLAGKCWWWRDLDTDFSAEFMWKFRFGCPQCVVSGWRRWPDL